jgi:hypothetical protein
MDWFTKQSFVFTDDGTWTCRRTAPHVTLRETGAQQIASELNNISNLTITHDSNNGYLEYAKTEGEEYSELDQLLMSIIDDHKIDVRLRGMSVDESYSHESIDGEKIGSVFMGSFEGNIVFGEGEDQKIQATQGIDITTIKNAEKAGFDKAGHVVAHELLEGYFIAQDFPGAKSTDQKAYTHGHLKSMDTLPLLMTKTDIYNNGMIKIGFGVAPFTIRPERKLK